MSITTATPTVEDVRKSLGISRCRLANLAGIHRSTIERIEHPSWGPKDHPYKRIDIDTATRIARALGHTDHTTIKWPFPVENVGNCCSYTINPASDPSRSSKEEVCGGCHMVMPRTGVCDNCS